jgi:hypothetical protein
MSIHRSYIQIFLGCLISFIYGCNGQSKTIDPLPEVTKKDVEKNKTQEPETEVSKTQATEVNEDEAQISESNQNQTQKSESNGDQEPIPIANKTIEDIKKMEGRIIAHIGLSQKNLKKSFAILSLQIENKDEQKEIMEKLESLVSRQITLGNNKEEDLSDLQALIHSLPKLNSSFDTKRFLSEANKYSLKPKVLHTMLYYMNRAEIKSDYIDTLFEMKSNDQEDRFASNAINSSEVLCDSLVNLLKIMDPTSLYSGRMDKDKLKEFAKMGNIILQVFSEHDDAPNLCLEQLKEFNKAPLNEYSKPLKRASMSIGKLLMNFDKVFQDIYRGGDGTRKVTLNSQQIYDKLNL